MPTLKRPRPPAGPIGGVAGSGYETGARSPLGYQPRPGGDPYSSFQSPRYVPPTQPTPAPPPPGPSPLLGAAGARRRQRDTYTAGPVYGGGAGGTPGMDGFGVSSLGSVGAPLASWSNAPKPWDAAAWQDAAAAGSKALGFGTYANALQQHGLPQSGGTPSTASMMYGASPAGGPATGLYGPFGAPVGPGGFPAFGGGAGGFPGSGGGAPSGLQGQIESVLSQFLSQPGGADLSGERDLIAQETARGRRDALRAGRESLSRQGMLGSGHEAGILAGIERDSALGEARALAELTREQGSRKQQGLSAALGLGSGYISDRQREALQYLLAMLQGGGAAGTRPSVYTVV